VSRLTVVVASPPSTFEAQLIVGMLESNGIAAAISSDDAGGQEPELQLTQGVRVLVAADDAAQARQLLADADSAGDQLP
jgi:hypothetical protein